MTQFIINNPIECAVLAVIIIALMYLIYKERKGILTKVALTLVAKAQMAWGSDTGKLKFSEVYATLKTKYPIITFFLSEETLTNIIENALEELKKIVAKKAEECDNIEDDRLISTVLSQIAGDSTGDSSIDTQ